MHEIMNHNIRYVEYHSREWMDLVSREQVRECWRREVWRWITWTVDELPNGTRIAKMLWCRQ